MSVVRTPKYRFHKARNCAVVTVAGRDHYLGAYDSPESREKYHRLVAEHLATAGHPAAPTLANPITIVELVARYWAHAKTYYTKNGKPTGEIPPLKQALKFLRRLYGPTPAIEFSPLKLKAVREAMIAHPITRKVRVVDTETKTIRIERKVVRVGLSRRVINKQIGRIKRVFAWAVEEELLPVEVHAALARIIGLKKGRSAAFEKPRVKPVAPEAVAATLPLVPPTVAAMITVQQLTGCRPQEVVLLRVEDIDRSGSVWSYRPRRHKTEHHNQHDDPDRDRVIFFGPKVQAVLTPLLDGLTEGFVFSPARSEATRNAARRANRASPLTPSQKARRPKANPLRAPRDRYDVTAYRKAIRRARAKAGIAVWTPNQLRHLRLTEIRKAFGLEAARVCGGHREVGVTQVYAERDYELARRVMQEQG
jgi:integrase